MVGSRSSAGHAKVRSVAKGGTTGEKAPKLAAKGKSAELKVGRIEAAMKALGQEHSDARLCLEELLKKAKVEEVFAQPPTRCVCCGGPREGWLGSRDLWQHWAQRTLKKGESWRRHCPSPAQQWHPWGSDWTSARNIANTKRLEEAQEVVRGAEGSDSEGGGVGGGAPPLGDTSCRSCCPACTKPPMMPGTDELAQLRGQVAQMEGELKLSHQAVSEKSMVESSLKRQVEQFMSEVASSRDRAEFGGTGVRETALVLVVPRLGSALMSDLIKEADKKRLRVTEAGGAPPAR